MPGYRSCSAVLRPVSPRPRSSLLVLLLSVAALCLVQSARAQHLQSYGLRGYYGLVADGDPQEWRDLGCPDCPPYDAEPVINIEGLNWIIGALFPDIATAERAYQPPEVVTGPNDSRFLIFRPTLNYSIAFLVRFGADGEDASNLTTALGDTELTEYEFLFDVYANRAGGCPDGPWERFFPDYRFLVRGRDGRIEEELYQRWDGQEWVGEGGTDVPEFTAAVGGPYLECIIPWPSLGSPLTRTQTDDDDAPFLEWAFQATQGASRTYAPDFTWTNDRSESSAYWVTYDQLFENDLELSRPTVIKAARWGQVKDVRPE